MDFENPHAITVSIQIETHSGGSIAKVLVVETDLELNVLHPNYHKEAVDSLLAELQMKIRGMRFDSGRLKQVARRTLA